MACSNLTAPESRAILERFSNYLFTHCSLSPSTVDLHAGYIRRMLPETGAAPTHDDLERYIANMRRREASYGHVVNAMKALEAFAAFSGDPIEFARPRKPDKASVATLSEARVAVMLHAAKNLRERAILTLLATTGLRNRELVSLRVRGVNLGQGLLAIELGKGSKGRLVYLTPGAIEILAEYLRERNADPDAFLFVTIRHGHQLQTQDIRKLVRVIGRRAGIKGRIWPHLLRHSLATSMLDRGASVYAIQALLGHAWVTTTMAYYLHPSRKSVQAEYLRCAPSYL